MHPPGTNYQATFTLPANEDPVMSYLNWTQGTGSAPCGATGQVKSQLLGIVNIGVCASGYLTERWTYTDECDRTITHERKVHYKYDNVKPYIYNVPASIVIPCGSALPPWPTNVTTGDNCPGPVSLRTRQIKGYAACGSFYWERSWIATDACGNVTVKKQNIHFSDDVDPVLNIGPDMVIECGDPVPAPEYEAYDDCSKIQVTYDEVRTDHNECEYTLVRTWMVRDACGNKVTKSQTIDVIDTNAPVITPVNPMLVGMENGSVMEMFSCDNPQILMQDVVVDDCCLADTEAKDELISTGHCAQNGYYRRFKCSVTAVDGAGNESEFYFYVHLVDTTAPEILYAPADVDVACGGDVPAIAQDVEVKDNCVLTKVPQFEEDTVYDHSDSSNYALIRTWYAQDDCENLGEATQIVAVCDFDKALLNTSIGNTVWFDANENGLQEAEEGGINDVKIILYSVTQTYSHTKLEKIDSTVSQTIDGVAGKYGFEVTKGTYQLQFFAPEGMSFTGKGKGMDEVDSDADPGTGFTDVFKVGYAEEHLTFDAGFKGSGVVADIGQHLDPAVQVLTETEVTVFPNPVTDYISVRLPVTESGEVKIKLLDQLGQEVVGQKEYLSKGSHTRSIDVSQVPTGMYLLHVSTPSGISSKMLIKQ